MLDEFTVFAVYEEDCQPFCTTVEAADADDAIAAAQKEADEAPLAGFQVVRNFTGELVT